MLSAYQKAVTESVEQNEALVLAQTELQQDFSAMKEELKTMQGQLKKNAAMKEDQRKAEEALQKELRVSRELVADVRRQSEKDVSSVRTALNAFAEKSKRQEAAEKHTSDVLKESHHDEVEQLKQSIRLIETKVERLVSENAVMEGLLNDTTAAVLGVRLLSFIYIHSRHLANSNLVDRTRTRCTSCAIENC